jgi:hypothetical protein
MTPKRPKRYWLTYLWTLPWDLAVVWPVAILMWLFWGKRLQWNTGLWAVISSKSWFVRKLYGSYAGTTLGHGGFIIEGYEGGEGIDTEVEYHEDQHVEQYEFIMLAGLVISAVFALVIFLAGGEVLWLLHGLMWVLSWEIVYLCSLLQAWLRGEKAYKGSALEESAYAQTEAWARKKFK